MRRLPVLLLFFLALSASPLQAQKLGARLRSLDRSNAAGFVAPLARGLGRALGAGFASPPDRREGLGFALGVRLSTAPFGDGDASFQPSLPSTVSWNGTVWENAYVATGTGGSPTVAGRGPGARLAPRPGSAFRRALVDTGRDPDASAFTTALPDGMGWGGARLAMIEGTLAIGAGTRIQLRAAPTVDLARALGMDGIGEVSAFGIGATQSLTRWRLGPPSRWDLSLVLGIQRIDLAEYAEAKGHTLGLVASAALGPLSLYATGTSTRGRIEFDYTAANPGNVPALPPPGARVTFSAPFDGAPRLAVGGRLDLLGLRVGAEYDVGAKGAISGLASFDLR